MASSEVLSAPLVLEYPFRRTTGAVQGAFLTGLRDGRVLGIRATDGRVLCPPVEYDPVTGDEHWRLAFADRWDAIYRAERLDGCELFSNVGQCPALEARWDELAPRFER